MKVGLGRVVKEQIGFVAVMLIAALSRLWNLSYPSKLVFDETYYVKDALTLSREGHEKAWPAGANEAFESGSVFGYLSESAFVVHPPLGKWLIASGMYLVGPNPLGWRLSTAVLGIATVALLMAVALKLFGSKKIAITAGLLLAIDGLAITLSRTALLDTALTFFLLLGFWFFLLDQQTSRMRIAEAISNSSKSVLWLRPYLLLAGTALGMAAAIKWSGLYLLAGIGLYVVFSETLLRKRADETKWLVTGVLKQGPVTFLLLIPIALATYLMSWIGWILGASGYARGWAAENPDACFSFLPNWARSLWHYHEQIYRFHINLSTEHSYQAHPLGWLLGLRPTAFFYESIPFGQAGCQSELGCSSAITALGNPLIWWAAAIALVIAVIRYLKNRERVVGLVLLGVGSSYLPWLLISERTVFQFYSVSFQPWLILALVLMLQGIYLKLNSLRAGVGSAVIVGFLTLALMLSVFFLPINTGILLPFDWWQLRMWLPSWV